MQMRFPFLYCICLSLLTWMVTRRLHDLCIVVCILSHRFIFFIVNKHWLLVVLSSHPHGYVFIREKIMGVVCCCCRLAGVPQRSALGTLVIAIVKVGKVNTNIVRSLTNHSIILVQYVPISFIWPNKVTVPNASRERTRILFTFCPFRLCFGRRPSVRVWVVNAPNVPMHFRPHGRYAFIFLHTYQKHYPKFA